MFNPKEYTCESCDKKFVRESRIERYHPVRFCSSACIGRSSRKHGMSTTSFYRKFKSIQSRCTNKKARDFCRYGGRGIKCEWKSFEDFKKDMFESYQQHLKLNGKKKTQIDRIDNDGNYSKDNCRWVTPRENAYNRTDNVFFEVGGEKLSLRDMSEKFNVNRSTLKTRIYVLGWTPEKACGLV